jgi:phosphoribosylformylglycinamidine synthase
LPVGLLTDAAPKYDRPTCRPAWQDDLARFSEPPCPAPGADLLALLGSPDHCSREWVWTRYDHQVGTATTVLPGADAAVVRVKRDQRNTRLSLAVNVDCNGRHVLLDPNEGAAGVIAECARNLACVGAEPIGATDCLNFGNPERPEIMWQFSEAIDGLARACSALGIPIVSGNVSLYNETDGAAVLPTPTVAMVGLIEGDLPAIRARFDREGLEVSVLGALPRHGVAASSWLSWLHGLDRGKPPPVDLVAERAVHDVLRRLIRNGVIKVAHDVSDGGVGVALAECCMPLRLERGVGLRGRLPGEGSVAGRLFGEDHGRVVIAYAPDRAGEVDALLDGKVTRTHVGRTEGDRLVLDDVLDVAVADLHRAWSTALPDYAAGRAAFRAGT